MIIYKLVQIHAKGNYTQGKGVQGGIDINEKVKENDASLIDTSIPEVLFQNREKDFTRGSILSVCEKVASKVKEHFYLEVFFINFRNVVSKIIYFCVLLYL